MTRQAGRLAWRTPSPLPGFSVSLGFTVAYLSLFVLIPLTALAIRPWENGFDSVIAAVASPRAQAALRLSFIAAAVAAAVNAIMGGLLAWVLTRYDFPGKRLADAVIDLPFALPTAVAGIALTALYAQNGPIGGLLRPWAPRRFSAPRGSSCPPSCPPFCPAWVSPSRAESENTARSFSSPAICRCGQRSRPC